MSLSAMTRLTEAKQMARIPQRPDLRVVDQRVWAKICSRTRPYGHDWGPWEKDRRPQYAHLTTRYCRVCGEREGGNW